MKSSLIITFLKLPIRAEVWNRIFHFHSSTSRLWLRNGTGIDWNAFSLFCSSHFRLSDSVFAQRFFCHSHRLKCARFGAGSGYLWATGTIVAMRDAGASSLLSWSVPRISLILMVLKKFVCCSHLYTPRRNNGTHSRAAPALKNFWGKKRKNFSFFHLFKHTFN